METIMNIKKRTIKQIMALSFLILVIFGLTGCGNLEVGALPEEPSPGYISEEAGTAGPVTEGRRRAR